MVEGLLLSKKPLSKFYDNHDIYHLRQKNTISAIVNIIQQETFPPFFYLELRCGERVKEIGFESQCMTHAFCSFLAINSATRG